MASKKFDLHNRYFFVLSGVSNLLGKTLALEICRRFKAGSVAMLIETSGEDLQELKKEIQYLENGIEVISCNIESWQTVNAEMFRQMLGKVINTYKSTRFDKAFILHNEGSIATSRLMEPDNSDAWKDFIQEHLYAAVALNQEFLKLPQLGGIEKLVINMTSTLPIRPLRYSSLMCSCRKARDMYFRAMASEEGHDGVVVLTYSPGILETHQPEFDANNNMIDLLDLEINGKMLKVPRIKPLQTTLKLINILEEISFISGHDVDYYDTFVL